MDRARLLPAGVRAGDVVIGMADGLTVPFALAAGLLVLAGTGIAEDKSTIRGFFDSSAAAEAALR